MAEFFFETVKDKEKPYVESLRRLLGQFRSPFVSGDSVGIKLHWGERGNKSFLPPDYAKEIIGWLIARGAKPFVFDTTVLYSGGRRTAEDSLKTAAGHGYTADYLGCPVLIADGMDGRDVVSLPADYKHFKTVQVASVFDKAIGFSMTTCKPFSSALMAISACNPLGVQIFNTSRLGSFSSNS